ncbi:MAG TPA: hypothetical protein EYO33_30335 [Phycisphaerales bacterium]|nr:hypothetical protein [Phycisphaerales bacterium]
MVKSSALAMQIALNGAARVRQGETPDLKKANNLTPLQGQQNLDFFDESLNELKARDNSDGDVSIHIFSAGPDTDPADGKVKVGNLEAEFEGDTTNGTRFSIETHGDIEKIKAHRFEESKVVVYEATVRPGNDMRSQVLILDRNNPGESLIGPASTDWLLS